MSRPSPSRRLYLRNLPGYVNPKALSKHLSSYGKILEVKMVHDYAFVQFDLQKDAQDVVDTFREQPFLGHDILVEFARPRRKDTPSVASYHSTDTAPSIPLKPRLPPANVQCRYPVVVSDIPRNIRWQELKDFGRIPGCLVAYCDLDRRRRGRGFIEYFSKEDAERAIVVLDNRYLGGERVRVSGRPEDFSRGRSCSPERGVPISRQRSYNDHRKSRPTTNYSSAYDCYYRRSPPPAYYPKSPTPYYHLKDRSTPCQPTLRYSDERDMITPQSSYPATRFDQGQYKEQYDYASHSLTLDAWKYDYDYGAGHSVDHRKAHAPGWEQRDTDAEYFQQA